MSNCKKCDNEFEVPANAIEPVYGIYCTKCIINAVRNSLKMPIMDYLKLEAHKVGLI